MRRRRGALPPGPAAAACSTLLLLVLVLASGAVAQEAEPPADASLAIGSPARAEQTLSTPHDDAGPGEEAMLSATLSAAPSAAAPQAALDTAGARAMLDSHNQYRARHQADSLVWSSGLAGQAAQYAAKCAFTPDPDSPAGENLFLTSAASDATAAVKSALKLWYQGAASFDYANPAFSPKSGAFTQMVWASTKQLGCATAACTGGIGGTDWKEGLLLVCRYSPAGNVAGGFRANVRPPLPEGGPPPPPPQPPAKPPRAEQLLPAGTRITSPNCMPAVDRAFRFCMQPNANIILYWGEIVMWSSNTSGASTDGPFTLLKKNDGTLVATDAKGKVYWASSATSSSEMADDALQQP